MSNEFALVVFVVAAESPLTINADALREIVEG